MDPSNPQSFNRYSYVLNRPLSFIDPSGLVTNGVQGGSCGICSIFATIFVDGFESLFHLGGGPSFHGNVKASQGFGPITPGDDGIYTMQVTWQIPQYISPISGGFSFNSGPAPNNALLTPKQQQCAGAALKKNAVALSFDAAGIGAGFLPGGDLVVAGAQGAVSVASGINSSAHGDASGATLGILGLPASFAGASAKFFGVGAKAIPGVGTAISALGALNDTYSAYQDYQTCLAGH